MIRNYALFGLILFACRDACTGALRSGLDHLGLWFLWYLADLVALGAAGIFIVVQAQRRQSFGMLIVAGLAFSVAVAVDFTQAEPQMALAAIKMILPVFSGLLFLNQTAHDSPVTVVVLAVLLMVVCLSVFAEPLVDFPWAETDYQSFSGSKAAVKRWWQQGVERYGGLSGDSALTAAMIVFLSALIAPRLPSALFWIIAPLCCGALWLTTSKTGLAVFVILCALRPMTASPAPAFRAHAVLRLVALASFGTILAPPVLMLLVSTLDKETIPPILASLADRAANTWPAPFLTIADVYPVGLATGCGLGCFSSPMAFSDKAGLLAPLDNFHLTGLAMFGPAYLVFVGAAMIGLVREPSRGKLVLVILFNLYALTVQAYAPSFLTMMSGYMLSGVFARAGARPAQSRPRSGPAGMVRSGPT
ncbi:hypothetical protein M2360_002288 [Rhizobium sp. SG_E_25_P2]|uniref:hypothetical protein n=1 Tax=Rhizobium sp. SG_E_25_P2 TaxID=2879942 RepID=UPI002476AE36|nr:hypothetical protein [Rhizobium sp. SG_E_25_P2]MDH6266891.1 hypothetical protein [Rhizobium sp. SG_E_25_P2]